MKNAVLLITIILFAQLTMAQENSETYTSLWNPVEKLENEELTTSALKIVRTIATKAKEEKNGPQIIKALLHQSKYVLILEEDARLKIVNDFKTEIDKAEFPTKNILESYLANLYWDFFQDNQYQFYNRTKTETKVDQDDFRTWDLNTLFQEIKIHFDASLKNEEGLRDIASSTFDVILNKHKGSEIYRPSLLDLLSHSALEFYQTNETNITRPADKFEIDNPQLLCEAFQFTKLEIDTTDQTSTQRKALQIYQQLLQHHIDDSKNEALIYIDIERLKFIYENAVFENKNELYFEVLTNSVEALKQNENAALYQYEIAWLYKNMGQSYNPTGDISNRWKLKEALEICESVLEKYPESKSADKCKSLKSQILAETLRLKNEQHIPVNTPSRLLVHYKNHNLLQLSARKISQDQLEKLDDIWEHPKKLAFLKKLPIIKEWEAPLKNEKDYQEHSTEIILPALPNDQYVILAMPKENKYGTFAYSPVQVTDFALVETRTATHQNFQVIDRNNGSPISGANLKFRYQVRHDGAHKNKTFISDKMGMVSIPLTKENWNDLSIHINHKKETAYYNDFYVSKKYKQGKFTSDYKAFIFTDRSIYRPGQPLFFKGIAIKRELGKSTVLENARVNVILKDVNYQEVSSQQFETNEYGSFSGEFILPSNGLTGNFSIQINSKKLALSGATNFSVEEYKRPKFETSFEPITDTFKVNDSVTVNGIATAYAGSSITDANVVYRVKRVVYFPRWYYWSRPYFNSTPQEIAHGETKTDASGKYEINFKALPENNSKAKDLPTFSYEVTADVTDINGETHSTTTTVRVGYHTMTANMYLPDPLDKEAETIDLSVSTSNLNGQSVPAKGSLKMYKLTPPENVLRSRPWVAPDYQGFSKEEFKNIYPHDAYSNEHDYAQWKKGNLVWESTFDTGESTEVNLGNLKKWMSGKYVIELETKDKFGLDVKDIIYTTLFSHNDKKLADNQLFQIKTDKQSYAIGDKVEITLLSSVKDLDITVFVEKNHNIIDTKLIHLNNDSKTFSVPITTDDLGGFSINYSYSAFNEYHSGSQNIAVPYPQKNLEIETLTFRDKLKPGTDESWSFKIKGSKGEKVAAELLASMYDASLDAFRGHYWGFNPIYRPTYYASTYSNAQRSFGTASFSVYYDTNGIQSYTQQRFDSFNWFYFYFNSGHNFGGFRESAVAYKRMAANAPESEMIMEDNASLDEVVITGYGSKKKKSITAAATEVSEESLENNKESDDNSEEVQIRKNLQETAFFFPQLQTDKDGNISFNFTTPEALTKWNLQLLAHTKDLQSIYTTKQTVTQKELMFIPNAPRFLREGDEIVISSKVANLTDMNLSGIASLELIDVVTGKDVTKKLLISPPSGEMPKAEGNFQVDSLSNTQVSWRLKIPENLQALQYKVIAKAGDFSDGEQNLLPVLTNRMLVTETLPMWVRSNQAKTFILDKLKNNSSTSLKHHKLTLEMTSNPAWYAVQALPYLIEYPHDCNEQMFSRYYANTLASHIANSNPRIQEVFDQWRNSDALLSNLEKNQELKSLLIQETPWLRDAQSETEQKKRIALLFNLDKMKNERANALRKLQNNQKSSGAWPWFSGGPDNRFITQHIIAGFGHLKKLSVTSNDAETQQMIKKAIAYLDAQFVDEYNRMKRYTSNLKNDHLSQTQIHYLYMRSFFADVPSSKNVKEITSYYNDQAQKYWMNRGLYSKGMLALILHRNEDVKTASKILRSLKENSITSEELGMYWKENTASWYWYQAPIETQALMIEAFGEIENDINTIDNLKIWLLKNKQTNQWSTTKATTEAVYALLLQGSDWLSVSDAVAVLVGGEKIEPSKLENVKIEAGTGYYKTAWNGSEITPKMAEVQITKKGEGIAWGAMYWQYFEDLDKITSAETPLKLKKKLFLKKNTDTGEELAEITKSTDLKVGDLVRVRIELKSDRDMEFIHMKDMRAAGFEPTNVISTYKWQDGLGYYENTKDASTNFFIDFLPKGVYVFEYDIRVNNAGEFSNGITTIQSMYAPEFSSHSEGVRVEVD
ncbi:alpha-2-macroglobulin [Aurantibacter crassamenti]|uniref:alpha-2-macroglobulin family protein n=1 Tax=Aurantibacter crassamenti TaxID=1837375 RepID=UPI001939C11F|nr:MG2 domain-containing protein [Aurantibacter crassamenti]MBM1106090.1 alpha-2-macroglobulin [Aurantibacter crassamenti]